MNQLKEQITQLSENEQLELIQEIAFSLSENSFYQLFLNFYSKATESSQSDKDSSIEDKKVASQFVSGEEMKSWIKQQIAQSENNYAEKMKNGQVKTFSLEELKSELNG